MGKQTTIPGTSPESETETEKKARTVTPFDREISLLKRITLQLQEFDPPTRARILAYVTAWVQSNSTVGAQKTEDGDLSPFD